MKLYNIYNIIVQYLFFCLLITITKSQQLPYKYFNYTESNLGDQNASYHIVDIKTYDDGTILVHIIRNESTQTEDCSTIRGMSLEQKLHDTIGNYSHKNLVNPITTYPLRKPFLLVTYVKTNNSSDPRNYEECGEVIDWNGKSRSNICFDSGASWNDSTIQLNANKKLGFIRSARNKAYEENGSSWNSWLWQHYSIITPRIGLCVIPISYNQTRDNQKSVIFRTEQPIDSVSCDETDSFIYCIVSIRFNNGTFNGMYYERIQIHPSGIEFSTHEIYSDKRSLRAKMTSFGDLIFDFTEYNNTNNNTYYNVYYYNDRLKRLEQQYSFITTNYFSVNAVTQNHSFLLASPNTLDTISWSWLTISLLNSNDYRYDNTFINKTFPSINDTISPFTTFLNITFNQPVYFSDGLSIIIKVILSTFNEYNEQYFVSMDNNFVKGADWNEPLRGIHDRVWIFKTVPINRSRLSSNNKIQRLYQDQILIPISIGASNDYSEKTAAELASDLTYMIVFKNITTISFDVANDLDERYNFRLLGRFMI
ncbi:hypothetical protein F8M41_014100 [Gigaspora margarita]|uniref:Uncharacterized protein n=1 Tax=Gigaspora margarita TaxID=4874 RepID=A0A8H4ENS0_GIGMA|nr:hypothetical protein F8M41_014100 [Gigaspora margarita]